MSGSKLQILIVDDHQILLDGIEAMLHGVGDFKVIGKCSDGNSALNFLNDNPVDIVLTDLYMPKMTGMELTQKVKKKFPNIKILALSVSYDVSIVHDLIDAGISGFIIKTIGRDELIEAIKTIAQGNIYFSREVSNEILRSLSRRSRSFLAAASFALASCSRSSLSSSVLSTSMTLQSWSG